MAIYIENVPIEDLLLLERNAMARRRESFQEWADYYHLLHELPKVIKKPPNWRDKLRGWSPY